MSQPVSPLWIDGRALRTERAFEVVNPATEDALARVAAADLASLANATAHGLAAYVFTRDLTRALRLAEEVEAGSVCVNEPHDAVHLPHGGLKQSGVGKDCSSYSLDDYLTIKRVSIRQ